MTAGERIENYSKLFAEARITPAELAVLFHVHDTIEQPRALLADWVAANAPNVVRSITVDNCLQAIDSLVRRGWLVELTDAAIEADFARWCSEPLPVSSLILGQTSLAGEIALTESGFHGLAAINRQGSEYERLPAMSYNDETPGLIRALGETEESTERCAEKLLARSSGSPWNWPRDTVRMEPIRTIGPWWFSRFELIPTGFEICLRRSDQTLPE